MKKFELTTETKVNIFGKTLFRIKALISFGDYTTVCGFGTQCRTTTFFRCKDKEIRVACGCFFGTIPEFREQVKKTRTGKIAEEYLLIANLMEKHFAGNDVKVGE